MPPSSETDRFAAMARYIVVFACAATKAALSVVCFRVDADGSNLKQLTNGQSDGGAVCPRRAASSFITMLGRPHKWVRIPLEGGAADPIERSLPKGAAKFPITGISPE